MRKVNVLPADTYFITNKAILTDYDRKIITLLYQPIIGSIAVNLYFTFWSLYENNKLLERNHYQLMTSMQLKLETIVLAREKLEGIGLLKTYYKKSSVNNFVYEIYKPLNAYEFFTSPLLNTLLMNNVGKEQYETIVNEFKKDYFDLTGYDNITCSFNEIFKMTSNDVYTNIETDIQYNVKNKVVATNININSIMDLIPDDILNKRTITKDLEDLINNLSFVYDLKEDNLRDIIINSIDVSHKIDKEKLKNNARGYYEFNNSGRAPKAIYKKGESSSIDGATISNKNKMIYTFENTSPYDFLCSRYGGVNPTRQDKMLLEYLLEELKLNPGVVNVIVDYALASNNNKLTKGYVESVASQFKVSGITTVKEALELSKKEYKNKKRIREYNTKKITSTPEWTNKKIESEVATKEEQEKMSRMLKELVGGA